MSYNGSLAVDGTEGKKLTGSDFEKKIIKIYKALLLMERSKQEQPMFSDAFRDLANIIRKVSRVFYLYIFI